MAREGNGSLIGRQLGTYELLRLLGTGGMAEVYLAHDLELDRRVAVKVLLREFTREPKIERRFRNEAKRVANLHHPHIIPIHAAGVSDDGLLYMVMPVVPRSLRHRLVQGPPLGIEESVRLAREVADALAAAHQVGIIHRDVKPENILLDEHNQALLTDFGIARKLDTLDTGLDHPPTMPTLSAIGLPVGTPEYMSPEQLRGVPVDQRADVYSLGAVLYEMLTGRLPHTGETPYLVAAHALSELALPPSRYNPRIWPELEAVVLCAMAANRDQRYPTASAFSAALAETLRRREVAERPVFVPSATEGSLPGAEVPDVPSEASTDLPIGNLPIDDLADAADATAKALATTLAYGAPQTLEVKTAHTWVRGGIRAHRLLPWAHAGGGAGWGWILSSAILLLTVGAAAAVSLAHSGTGRTSSTSTTLAGLAAQSPQPGASHTANGAGATASAVGATTTAQGTAQGTPQATTSPSASATPGPILTLSPKPLPLTSTNGGTTCTGTQTITNPTGSGGALGWQWTAMSAPPSGWTFTFTVTSSGGTKSTYQYPSLPSDAQAIPPGGQDTLAVTAAKASASSSPSPGGSSAAGSATSLSVLPVGPCAFGGPLDVTMTDSNHASYPFQIAAGGGVAVP